MKIQIVEFEDGSFGLLKRHNLWNYFWSDNDGSFYNFETLSWKEYFLDYSEFKRPFEIVLKRYIKLTKKNLKVNPLKINRVWKKKELDPYLLMEKYTYDIL